MGKVRTYKGKSLRPGGGGQFQKMVDAMVARGHSKESARRIAAAHGMKKYGKARMMAMARAGRRRAAQRRRLSGTERSVASALKGRKGKK